jgi:hypothetical protein
MPQDTPRGYTYPLYTDAANFPAQIQNFAQDVDVDVQSLINASSAALNTPSARALATANQAIPASTSTNVTFTTETYDNAAMINLGVNADRVTFTSPGVYLINAECNFAPNNNATVGERGGRLIPSAGPTVVWNASRGAQTADTELSLTGFLYVPTAGIFINFSVWHNSGAAVNITARSISAMKVVVTP